MKLRTGAKIALLALIVFFAAVQPAAPKATADTRPVIFAGYMSFAGEIDTSTVRMVLDGEDVTARAKVSDVRVSYRPDTPLSPGEHSVRVEVGSGPAASEKTWVFEVVPQDDGDVSVFLPDRLSVRFSPVPTPSRDPVHDVGGITWPGAEVELRVNGVWQGTDTARDNGQFTFPGIPLREGANEVTAVATLTTQGLTSAIEYLRPAPFVDAHPPLVVLVSPAEGEALKAGPFELHASIDDGEGVGIDPRGVVLVIDGVRRVQGITFASSSLTYRSDTPAPGRHEIRLSVEDRVENRAPEASSWFTAEPPVDDGHDGDDDDGGPTPEPPPARPTVLSPAHRAVLQTDIVDVLGRAEALHPIRLLVNGRKSLAVGCGADGIFVFEHVRLAAGENRIVAEDIFPPLRGTLRSDAVAVTYRKPGIPGPPPQPLIERPASGATLALPQTDVSGRGAPGHVMRLFVNNRITSDSVAAADGRFVFPRAALQQGVNRLMVEDHDRTLEAPLRSQPVTVTVEREGDPDEKPDDPPQAARPVIDTPVDGAALKEASTEVTGRAEAGHLVRIVVNGKPAANTTTSTGGAFLFRKVDLKTGRNTLSVEDVALRALRSDAVIVTVVSRPHEDPPDDENADDETSSDEQPDDGSDEESARLVRQDLATVGIVSPPTETEVVKPFTALRGTAPPLSAVAVLVNERVRARTRSDAAGRVSVPRLELEPGDNRIRLMIEGFPEQTSEPITVVLRLDAAGPAQTKARIVSPQNGAVLQQGASITGVAPGADFARLVVNGTTRAETAVSHDGRFMFRGVTFETGLNELVVDCFDLGGNRLASTTPVRTRVVGRSPAPKPGRQTPADQP